MSKRYIGKEKEIRQVPLDQNIQNFDEYYVQEGDTLYDVAKENNIDASMLAEINGLLVYDYLYPNQLLLIPKKGVKLYITKEGDTITSVVNNNDITESDLIKSNSSIYLLPNQLLVYRE